MSSAINAKRCIFCAATVCFVCCCLGDGKWKVWDDLSNNSLADYKFFLSEGGELWAAIFSSSGCSSCFKGSLRGRVRDLGGSGTLLMPQLSG